MQPRAKLALLICFGTIDLSAGAGDGDDSFFLNDTQPAHLKQVHVRVAHLKWDSVQEIYIIVLWLLLAGMAKLMFNRAKRLTRVFPESSLLIVIGVAIGYVLERSGVSHSTFTLDSHSFFIYLLPPIIFDAGYFMPIRAFFRNWDSIVLFSVVGTLFNTLAIGGSLYVLSLLDIFTTHFAPFEILLFSALISAVDPVAVIAVFEDIHVNDFIFVNVFGEALFNDGVTVVLYELFLQFLQIDHVAPIDYVAGGASFFVIVIGGTVVGLVGAVTVALLTKYSYRVMVLAPLFIFAVPYTAYLTAEALSLSPIIAIAVCGMTMKQYVKGNVTANASNSVKYFTKVLAQASETVIFLFLGLSTISAPHLWDTAFVVLTIVMCIVWRTVGVALQCALLNRFRGKTFTNIDQFILSYGGLRGAIAFGLANSIDARIAPAKPLFLTTTIAVIYFTVFLQGATIRPLIKLLNIPTKKQDEPTMAESVYVKYLDYMISGVEDIAGQKGHASLVHDFERINNNIICPILMREHAKTKHFDATKIVRAYAKLILRDAMGQTTLPVHTRIADFQLGDPAKQPPSWLRPASHCVCQGDSGRPGIHTSDCPLQSPSMETLFNIFSQMLDSKLDEIRTEMKHEDQKDAGAIDDDYIKQMNAKAATSTEEEAERQQRKITRAGITGAISSPDMRRRTSVAAAPFNSAHTVVRFD